MSNWIDPSKALPEEFEYCLVWYEYYRYGEYNCMWRTYGLGYVYNGNWYGNDLNGELVKVLRWMPLPNAPVEFLNQGGYI